MERQPGDLVALAKADLRDGGEPAVSGLTGAGIDWLLGAIAAELRDRASVAGAVTHERQRSAVEQAWRRVQEACGELAAGDPRLELVAEDVRAALRALDFLVGRVDVEAVLDVVFRKFCLGK